MTDPGDTLTRGTVRVAVVLYAVALGLRLRGRLTAARAVWTVGFTALALHFLAAFHFIHGWSHAEAVAATSRQTAAVVGWDWGGGVWVNYLFAVVWLADAAWWWRNRAKYEARPWWAEWAVQGFLGFIVFNATVVFADGVMRWVAVIAGIALVALATIRRGWAASPHSAPTPTGSVRSSAHPRPRA